MYNFDQVTERRGTRCVKWDETASGVLPLWVGDMDFPTAPTVHEAIVRRATHGCYGYTAVPEEYYQAIRDWFAVRHQWNIGRDEILYTIGVIPAIAASLKALCQTGDNVVVLTPIYNCFFNLIRNAGCQAVEVPLSVTETEREGIIRYEINWTALTEALALEKTTVLLFCNPHNPAGRVWNKEQLHRVAALCHEHHVAVVCDEIHNELTEPDLLYTPFAPVAETLNRELCKIGRTNNAETQHREFCKAGGTENAEPLGCSVEPLKYIVCTSPSKAFNIAGLQNANLMIADAELRRRVDRAINLNEVCDVNPFGVEAVIAAYNEGSEWLDALRSYIYGNYAFARDLLLDKLPELRIAEMQGTYFMWVDCRRLKVMQGKNVAWLCDKLTEEAKVRLCAGQIYGKAGEGFVRINLACPRSVLSEALSRFIRFVNA